MLEHLADLPLYATAEWGLFAGWKGIIVTKDHIKLWRDDVYLGYFEARERARHKLSEFMGSEMRCQNCRVDLGRYHALVDLDRLADGVDELSFYCSLQCWDIVMGERF